MKQKSNINYCSNCGTKNELKRINKEYVFSEISSVLNFDKGILYTIKELLIRPGITIRCFISEDRNRLVKPIIFIIISSLIYTALRQALNFEDDYIYIPNSKSTSTEIFKWIQNNYGYGNLIMGVFIAFWTKVIFKKYGYNFYELLILLCFVMGIGMLIIALFGTIEVITKFKTVQFGSLFFLIYLIWSIGQFFDKNRYLNYLKAFFSYLFGLITFNIVIVITGALIDSVIYLTTVI